MTPACLCSLANPEHNGNKPCVAATPRTWYRVSTLRISESRCLFRAIYLVLVQLPQASAHRRSDTPKAGDLPGTRREQEFCRGYNRCCTRKHCTNRSPLHRTRRAYRELLVPSLSRARRTASRTQDLWHLLHFYYFIPRSLFSRSPRYLDHRPDLLWPA